MDIRQKVGIRVKDLRNFKGISQEKLAFQADVDRTYINSVENGKRNVSVQTLQKIITGLNTSFAEFFNNESFRNE